MAEVSRWGIELDEEDYRDLRDTMIADRVVEIPVLTKPQQDVVDDYAS